MRERRLITTAAATVCTALVVGVPAASAKTIRLNWTERISNEFGYVAMTFKVKDVVLGRNAWAVHGSVTNRSRKTIQIVRPIEMTSLQQYGFGLGFTPTSCSQGHATCGLDLLLATYARPRLPASLPPGRSWSGVFGGPKLPPKGKGIAVTFGYFRVSRDQHYSYATTHEFRR